MAEITVRVDPAGPRLVFNRTENVATLVVDACPPIPLAPHPDPAHMNRDYKRPPVLRDAEADLVTSWLQMPQNPDPSVVYVGRAYEDGSHSPFARVFWFHEKTSTVLAGTDLDGSRLVDALDHIITLMKEGDEGMETKGGHGTQPASGQYVELGTGVLPGRGRNSILVDGKSRSIPFSRGPMGRSDDYEGALSVVCAAAALVATRVLQPNEACVMRMDSGPSNVVRAYQYPRQYKNLPCASSHQVALRRPADRSGLSHIERQRVCLRSVSDLHVDREDGSIGKGQGRGLGSMAIYACRSSERGDTSHNVKDMLPALSLRDLVVFPRVGGGRGVRVRVMHPGWLCIVLFVTSEQLHGGVCAQMQESEAEPTLYLPEGLNTISMFTYPLKRVQALLERLERDGDAVHKLLQNSDHRLLARMRM